MQKHAFAVVFIHTELAIRYGIAALIEFMAREDFARKTHFLNQLEYIGQSSHFTSNQQHIASSSERNKRLQ